MAESMGDPRPDAASIETPRVEPSRLDAPRLEPPELEAPAHGTVTSDPTRDRIDRWDRRLSAGPVSAMITATMASPGIVLGLLGGFPALAVAAGAAGLGASLAFGIAGSDLVRGNTRRALLRRAASRARPLSRIADAGDGELIAICGRVYVVKPERDPVTGSECAAWIRWTFRTGGCACLARCVHPGPRTFFAVEGRCGQLMLRDGSGCAQIPPSFVECSVPIRWREARAGAGGVIVAEDDCIRIVGRARRLSKPGGDGYREAGPTFAIEPVIARVLILDRVDLPPERGARAGATDGGHIR